jgi:hypothetical protein
MRVRTAVTLISIVPSLAACFDLRPTDDRPGITERTAALPLGPNDVRIVSTDGGFELALVGTTVVMRLSDAGVARLRRELSVDHADVGVGNWIEQKVKGAVQGLVDKQMLLPVAAIREARYEGGEIRFIAGGDGRDVRFFGTSDDHGTNGSVMGRFAPSDAERFVAAVRAAKARS